MRLQPTGVRQTEVLQMEHERKYCVHAEDYVCVITSGRYRRSSHA